MLDIYYTLLTINKNDVDNDVDNDVSNNVNNEKSLDKKLSDIEGGESEYVVYETYDEGELRVLGGGIYELVV
jgi:hypothetical protein